jgi:hypothetical protein
MNIEVEIYISNLIKFFKDNPNDLENLISREYENIFYSKLKKYSYQNFENGEDIILTNDQITMAVKEVKNHLNLSSYIQSTEVGILHLN